MEKLTNPQLQKIYEQIQVTKNLTMPIFFQPTPFVPYVAPSREIKENPFEPRTFSEFIGQENAKEVLKIIVDSANKEHRLIPNILLTGAYGHGKTTLAKLIAKRHHKKIDIVDGSIAGDIIKPSTSKIYIVDEAHNIPAQLMDSYNILMDSGNLRIIACTTNPGELSAPFRSRFRSLYLEGYTPLHITKIVKKAATRANLKINPKAASVLGNRSKCNPRNALTLLDFIREISSLKATSSSEVSVEDVDEALAKLGIDFLGLTNLDRKYLELLKYDRPTGLQYISSALSQDVLTIQTEIEPYLMQIGLVERTPRGRILTFSSTTREESSPWNIS
jgi:holliday junction DNA helicase RuvB